MTDTIFDKIIRREIPADIVYEDDEMLAFRDVNPQAPVHVLFIPKRRIATLNDLQADDGALVGRLFATAVRWAKNQGFADDGYRCAGYRRNHVSAFPSFQIVAAFDGILRLCRL